MIFPERRQPRWKRARSHAEWGPDPHLKELRKAVSLVKEAERLRWSRKYKEASEKCDEALECSRIIQVG